MKFQTFEELERNQKHPLPGWGYPVAVILLTIIIWGIVAVAHAETPNMAIIQQIESGGNPEAYNSYSGARGLYQITIVVLQEYNQFNHARYTKHDLYDARINTKIATWYMRVRITQLLKAYHKPLTLVNYIKSYNAGIRSVVRGYMPEETADYIEDYQKLAKLEAK
jgi:hypothetical protein